MPNYRCNTSDYMRRSGCSRPSPMPQPPGSCRPSSSACCEDRAEYDELNGMPIAMAYVPWQEWQNIYEAEKGFHQGTIFEELNKPFTGIGIGGCCR